MDKLRESRKDSPWPISFILAKPIPVPTSGTGRECLHYLSRTKVAHKKAITLHGRINLYYTEWLIFVDDVRDPPTNNLAERALRPLVVLRKITFGNHSADGGRRMAMLMSVAETARRPDIALKRLLAGAK